MQAVNYIHNPHKVTLGPDLVIVVKITASNNFSSSSLCVKTRFQRECQWHVMSCACTCTYIHVCVRRVTI